MSESQSAEMAVEEEEPANHEEMTASPSVQEEPQPEVDEAALAEKKRLALEACREFTKDWLDEEPFINVEQPYPGTTEGSYCWYDLSEEWSDLVMPQAVKMDYIDRRFRFNQPQFVNLPFAEGQRYIWGTSKRERHELIPEALHSFSRGIRDLTHLQAGIRTYWREYSAKCLTRLFEGQSDAVVQDYLVLISKIAKLALRSDQIVTRPLPLLRYESTLESVSMSQEQAACLLAYSFFCCVSPKEKQAFNHFSFHVFHLHDEPIFVEKMKFILHYFKAVTDEMPRGTLTFSRQFARTWKPEEIEQWTTPLAPMHVTAHGLIEEMEGCLQVDFANMFIGGGVMRAGAVQEEIRFLCCPEMLVSLLLCEKMHDDEAILIQGAQQYSAYEGYMFSLRHVPMNVRRDQPRDRFGRARSYLIAMDAVHFNKKETQYQLRCIDRELNKAMAGFQRLNRDAPARPIATGNWGCGVFNGDRELKSLIQLIAASRWKRPVIYVSWNDEEFATQLTEIYKKFTDANVKTGKLFELLANYQNSRQPGQGVFAFLESALENGFAN